MSNSYNDKTTNITNNNEENSETKYQKYKVYENPNSTKKNVPKEIIIYTTKTFDHVFSKAVVDGINCMLNQL